MATEMREDVQSTDAVGQYIEVNAYRRMVQTYISMRRYRTALFWAEKVAVLNNFDVRDVYWQAQCMFLLKEYHRAATLIRFYGFEKTDVLSLYLVAECLYEAKDYQEALNVLRSAEIDDLGLQSLSAGTDESSIVHLNVQEQDRTEILSSICFIKGKILEAMDNRDLAMEAYVQALKKNVNCYEALDSLVQHEMLMAWEEKVLLEKLPFSQQCTDAEQKLIYKLYESKLKKYSESVASKNNAEITPIGRKLSTSLVNELTEKMKRSGNIDFKSDSMCFTPVSMNALHTPTPDKILSDLKSSPAYSIHSSFSKMSDSIKESRKQPSVLTTTAMALPLCLKQIENSVDIISARAEKLFYNGEYKKSLALIDEILKRDIYHQKSLTIKIECLVELKETTNLFYLAHKLIDLYPDEAIAWYAVGCYYDLIGKSDQARRYLSKATTLDRLFGPAWLAYGHSFAKENEHDQAMAAYFKAAQLMRGCHLPLLYIGVECGLTKNLDMAEKFFYQAMNIAPLDVFVLFELGVIKFEYELYDTAEEIFKTTLDMVVKIAKTNNEPISPRWEPLLNNLGHCCRKNKKFEEALEYHRQALALKPLSAATYTAIGFVQALMGQLENAIESFHKSLSLKRDDGVTTTILKEVIEDLVDSDNFISSYKYDDMSTKEQLVVPPRMWDSSVNSVSTNAAVEPTNLLDRLNCVKLRFDDSAEPNESSSLNMSID